MRRNTEEQRPAKCASSSVVISRVVSDLKVLVHDIVERAFIDLLPEIQLQVKAFELQNEIVNIDDIKDGAIATSSLFWDGKADVSVKELRSAGMGMSGSYDAKIDFNITSVCPFKNNRILNNELSVVIETKPTTNKKINLEDIRVIRCLSLVSQALDSYIGSSQSYMGHFHKVGNHAVKLTLYNNDEPCDALLVSSCDKAVYTVYLYLVSS